MLQSLVSIPENIDKDLLDLLKITVNRRHGLGPLKCDGNRFLFYFRVQQYQGVGHDLLEIMTTLFPLRIAGIIQKVVNNIGNPDPFFLYPGNQVALPVAQIFLIQKNLAVVDNAGDRIIDFMSNAGRQFADRGKLRRADSLRLHFFQILQPVA